MKKFFAFALVTTALLGFSACSSENDDVNADKGYISLGVSIDNTTTTRTTQNATVADWYAVVTNGEGDPVFGTLATKALIGSELATTPFVVGSYNIAVSNFADDDDWLTANGGFGAAYYEGNASDVAVTAGNTTPVAIECGKAQNAKFSIVSTGFSGTALDVNVTAPRALTFSKTAEPSTIGNEAFFAAGAELTYTITYTINGTTKTSAAKTLTLGAAGSANTLTIKSNTNGSISVSITYDDEFTEGNTDELEIDSATGDEL